MKLTKINKMLRLRTRARIDIPRANVKPRFCQIDYLFAIYLNYYLNVFPLLFENK